MGRCIARSKGNIGVGAGDVGYGDGRLATEGEGCRIVTAWAVGGSIYNGIAAAGGDPQGQGLAWLSIAAVAAIAAVATIAAIAAKADFSSAGIAAGSSWTAGSAGAAQAA